MTDNKCSPLQDYISDWARIIWDATGDQTKVDRAILLADLHGMFDPVKVAGLTSIAQASWQPIATNPFVSAKRYLITEGDRLAIPFVGFRIYEAGPWQHDGYGEVYPTHWMDLPDTSTLPSNPRATPIDHSNEECPNFPGCHCVDHCCDGWKHPSPEISSTDRGSK